jgi:ATP-dependent RNA circularization protein (DNA/RNA ligase family)
MEMSKVEELVMVADMVGLESDYVVKEANYFKSINEAFHWIYLSEENPLKPYSKEELINVLASITVEDLQDENVNTVAEYMVLQDKDTYITKTGVAYLRIQR